MKHSTDQTESSQDAVDPELEQLLVDSFDAPPVPRSLLKRLDRAIEQEWGTSPRLADSATAKLGRGVVVGSRWVRSLPIAAALSVVLLVWFFTQGSQTFAWSSFVEALTKQGVVQVQSSTVRRWLTMSEGVIAERDDSSSRLFNAKAGEWLEHENGVDEIRRRKLATSNELNKDEVVLAFLLGGSRSQYADIRGAKVIRQESKLVTHSGEERIKLDVQFQCVDPKLLSISVLIHPDSNLPISCETNIDDVVQEIAFSYPTKSAAKELYPEFSQGLPVVEATDVAVVEAPKDKAVVSVQATELLAAEPNAEEADLSETEQDRGELFADASTWKPVIAVNQSAAKVVNQLDAHMGQLWKENGVQPATLADEQELLRRVYLDLAGRTPSVPEVRQYLNDEASQRYVKLVDRLLNSADHASHLATTYRTFLIPEGVDLTAFGGVEAFDKWLSERFASNDSYDEVVRSLLLAEGRLSRSGPLLFYSAAKLDADQLAARTSRVFLGMRLECAQCHDHPFEPWTQEDFWSFAAFFARIARPNGELENVSTLMQVRDVKRGEVMLPDTETVMAPKFLNSKEYLADGQADQRRQKLANWLTGADNPYFPRAAANRVWGQMFGKGIVDPIDDFGIENPPVSAELLELLAGRFVSTKFDLRDLFRTVALSKAYQLSSGAETVDEDRMELFAQMNVKTLTAEQIYDCVTVATMPSGSAATGFNVARIGNTARDAFLQQFRTPVGRATEYQGGIPQALTLMNGTLIDGATGLASSGLLKSLEAPFFSNKQRVEVLFFATLSRRPTTSEWELLGEYVTDEMSGPERKENLADILWSLLNSAEFTLNH